VKHQIQYSILTDKQLAEWEKLVKDNIESLLLYSDQLLWWNKKANLVSRDVSHETVLEHIKHSLLLGAVDSFKSSEKLIDTGSGGGLPGIPLSICFPDKQIVVNDIISKKVMAMKQIGFKLNLSNLKTAPGSIAHQSLEENQLIITKHSFKVDELVELLGNLPWKKLLFLKGANEAEPEIKRLDIPVSSNIIELDVSFDDPFYKGKGIVEINRLNE
jgi:16S rRNA (guanine527-N7)-methyltransferase